jgi:NTE family protein
VADRVAFVLGGGGVRGAVEIGMLRALLERGIRPDVLVGTSIGAVNAAYLADDPNLSVIEPLIQTWTSPEAASVYGDGVFTQLGRFVRTRTHLHSPEPLRRQLEAALGADATFEGLAVELKVVAAAIEKAEERVLDRGPLIPAILASAAVPGFFPAAEIDGEHFFDGGLVNSIPISPALDAGATTIYVLQVGRVEQPLEVPRTPTQTAQIAFEIARRHRFARDVARLPSGVRLHVLPSGGPLDGDESLGSYRRMTTVRRRIDQAYEASHTYLESIG